MTRRSGTADEWSEYERLREDAIGLRRSIKEVSETAYSSDGLVRATVGSGGEVLELCLDPRIYRNVDAAALAETITATIRVAHAGVSAQLSELAKPFLHGFGGGVDAGVHLTLVPILRSSGR